MLDLSNWSNVQVFFLFGPVRFSLVDKMFYHTSFWFGQNQKIQVWSITTLQVFYIKVKPCNPMLVKYDQCEFLENTGFCIHTSAIHCDCPTYTVIIRTVHTAIITIYLHHHFPPKSFK